jgi:hypothetical protein
MRYWVMYCEKVKLNLKYYLKVLHLTIPKQNAAIKSQNYLEPDHADKKVYLRFYNNLIFNKLISTAM